MWLTVENRVPAWEITPVGFTLWDQQRQYLPPPPLKGGFYTPLTFPTSGCLELQLTNPFPRLSTHADAQASRQFLCSLIHFHFFLSWAEYRCSCSWQGWRAKLLPQPNALALLSCVLNLCWALAAKPSFCCIKGEKVVGKVLSLIFALIHLLNSE